VGDGIPDVMMKSDKNVSKSWHPELFLEHFSASFGHQESAKGKTMQSRSAALLEFSLDKRIGKNANNLLKSIDLDLQFQEFSTIASCSVSPNSPNQTDSKPLLKSADLPITQKLDGDIFSPAAFSGNKPIMKNAMSAQFE
jgi:hypothetical protein